MTPLIHLDKFVGRQSGVGKKDHLTVSFEIFRESLVNFQKAAKIAKAKYYSDIINKHSHTPKILFSTINSIINPRISYGVEQSTVICERFLRLFVEKIAGIRSSFDPLCSRSLVDCSVSTDNLYSFQPVSLWELGDLVKQTKSSTSPYDVVPSDFLKEDFDTVGPSIQVIINSCLVSGTVPAFLKHAVVQPLLKKTQCRY